MFACRSLWCSPALALALATAGCNHGPQPVRMAVLSDSGGFTGTSFSAQAAAGLETCSKVTGANTTAATPSPADDYEGGLALLATENYDPVVAVGVPMEGAVAAVARRFDTTHFDLLDATVNAKNVTSVHFAEGQGAYLAGALAALASKSKRIAFLGGEPIGRLAASRAGFAAGAHAADPGVRVEVRYAGSFSDPAAGRAAALALGRDGVDVTYVVAGPAGLGAIAAFRAQHRYAIGADSDQDAFAPGTVLASVVKRFDVAADVACREAVSQKPTFGTLTLGVADGAIGLTRSPYAGAIVTPQILARVAALQRRIAAGDVVAPAG